MRIIKGGNGQMVPERPCACIYCRCEFVFREDEARLVTDPRDGDYFRIGCPQCRVLNSVSIKVPTLSGGGTTMIELRRIDLPMARENTAADFQVGDIVGHEEDIDEYEVLALHPYPGHPNSDTMTLRCLVEETDDPPYMKKGEIYDCCKCRRYDLKRRSQSR